MSDLQALASDAYVYGYPMVFNLDEVDRFTRTGMNDVGAAPFNTFSHATKLAGPDDTFVSLNNDTVYSMAQIDLSTGPLLLTVPGTGGRYYVMQFVDAWTNNFAYVGRRATGTRPGRFLCTPPGWAGKVPQGATRIAFPTAVASIVTRWACAGEADIAAVRALQDDTTLEPHGAPGEAEGLPVADVGVVDVIDGGLMFFEKLRVRMAAFPPAPADIDYQGTFAPLGLLKAVSPYTSPDPELAEALRAGFAAGKEKVELATTHGMGPEDNGWKLAYHAFDYNADFFEIGTVTDPAWIIEERTRARVMRAAAARAGLWGNHGYEAAYAMTWNDAAGEPLDGGSSYTLRFEKPPPVNAFWSVTMYDLPEYHLVDNPADRYSIGDRTPGLVRASDGSLTLRLSRERPADESEAANWLPTPPGRFRPVLRMYEPRDAVVTGSYRLPPITRVS